MAFRIGMCLVGAALALAGLCGQARAAGPNPEAARLVKVLAGLDAAAENEASQKLVALGEAAVPALAQLAGAPGPLAPRLLAVERLGDIRTPAALDALVATLKAEKDPAVRGQICMQLGTARHKAAVSVIADGLRAMAAGSLADVHGPKEVQASTVFIRHVEALEMICDGAAIPILEELAPQVPKIAPEGFLRNFVAEAVKQAIQNLREDAAFWNEVRTHAGLEEKLGPLFAHLRASPLARLRIWEDEIVRHTAEGRRVLQRLAPHADPKVAAGAKALLEVQWSGAAGEVKP